MTPPANPQVKTVLEIIRATADYFEKHGVDSPRLNAEHLLAHVLKTKRLELYLEFDRPVGESLLQPLRNLVRQRSEGVPLQHLLGTAEFHGRTFLCDKRALIPRPETEQLVEILLEDDKWGVKRLEPEEAGARILDVGTGSGVIAITLALELPTAQVDAVDLSEQALALARENARKHGLQDRVRCFQGNLLERAETRYDLIVANLPYIPSAELPELQHEVRHDPPEALDGGPNGLQLIRVLLDCATRHMKTGGQLALEIGLGQSGEVLELAQNSGFKESEARKDFHDIERFVFARNG